MSDSGKNKARTRDRRNPGVQPALPRAATVDGAPVAPHDAEAAHDGAAARSGAVGAQPDPGHSANAARAGPWRRRARGGILLAFKMGIHAGTGASPGRREPNASMETSMGRMAPVLWLLALAGCAAEQTTPAPSAPAQARAAARAPIAPPLRGYVDEVDELFRALAEHDARAGTAAATATGTSPPRLTAESIPRVGQPSLATGPRAAFEVAYGENLEVCLDGRFPAFCDHERLTAYDAARVQEAEYEANLVTCIDPQWQHLCRPELLPENFSSRRP
jgi:hypothetical protein